MDEDLDLKTRLSCMAYALAAQHSDKCAAVVNDAIAEIERLEAGLRAIVDACENCITCGELVEIAGHALHGEDFTKRQPCDSCCLDDARKEIERLRPLAEKWIARHRPPHDVNMFYFGDDLSPLDCVEPDPEVESVVNKHFWELI